MMKISEFNFAVPAPQAPAAASKTDALNAALARAETTEALFQAVAAADPQAPALTDDDTCLSFAQLDELSAAVAGFIVAQGYGPEAAVGVLCRRGALFLAAGLGALRAGAVYLPVERELSLARQEILLKPARLLITDRHGLRDAEYLRYRNPGIAHVLCLDTPNVDTPNVDSPNVDAPSVDAVLERGTELSSTAYWEGVTEGGPDQGWRSWFDAQPLPGEALEALAANVMAKTGLVARARRRVLDIGCGSGAVARALAAASERYTALDIARNELGRTHSLVPEAKVHTHQMTAVDIRFLPKGEHDVVVLNGVAEFFPGYNYLRRMLDDAVALMAEGGVLFVGAVPDLDRRDAFREALKQRAEGTGVNAGLLRLDSGAELFVPERFFAEWAARCPLPVEVEISRPVAPTPELAEYRFDVVVRRADQALAQAATPSAAQAPRTRFGMAEARALAGAGRRLPACAPEQAAYIVYTSGSTGLPKGVVVEHRNLMHILRALRPLAEGCASVGLVAPLSFDASIQQLAVSLFCGKPLHVMSDAARKSPERFCQSARSHRVDLCDMTPAFFNVLVDHLAERREPLPVRRLLLAGEVLRPDVVRKLYAIPGNEGVELYNVYGPTECTVDSSALRIDMTNHAAFAAYPIGAPLAGVEASIRDKDGRALPEGEQGEIWITGAGVSRGYLGGVSPEAFAPLLGRRCYRTGDQGFLRGGLLHYAGREDQQVKIRGNRVEIGEVESAIAGFPGVRQVAVVADTYRAEEGRSLAAYVVGGVDLEALRGYLEQLLPQFCVPAYLVPMVELPLSINRKVDKKALPSPLAAAQGSGGRRPAGQVEERLADMWRRLLGVEVTDADASFFRLGGNSIMAIRLSAMIEKELGAHIAVGELFTSASIAAQAALLAGQAEAPHGPVIKMCHCEGGPSLFLFHPVGGSVFCYSKLAEELSASFSVYAVEAAGFRPERVALNTELQSVEELAEYYLGEILKVGDENVVFGGWSFGGLVAYETACRYAARGYDPGPVVILDTVADNANAKRMAGQDDISLLKEVFATVFNEEMLRSLPAEEKLPYLLRSAEEAGILPPGFRIEHMESMVRTYRSNAIAAARYENPTPSNLKILFVRALDFAGNPNIVPEDDYQGWARFLKRENVRLMWTQGSHQSMLTPGFAENVAKLVRGYFDEAR